MRTLKLFGLGTAVAVLAVSFWTNIVRAQQQIAVYRVQPVQVTRDSVLKLAREAFGMTSPTVSEDSTTFMLQQEQKRLTVWKASGAILFADDSKLWNPDYHPSLPPLEEAVRLGEEFVRKHNLVPTGGKLILHNTRVRSAPAHQEGAPPLENHWELSYTLFQLETGLKAQETGSPLQMGAGALTLELGSHGEVIGLQRELGQQLGPPEFQPLLSRQESTNWLRWKAGQGNPIELLETSEFGFSFRGSAAAGYSFILPGYRNWAFRADHEHVWHYVPATTFAVLARIRAPLDGARFRAGFPVEFRAEIAAGFGAPPYQYLWYSNRDGILSRASTFRKELSSGRHAITLWVSDRRGTADAHVITVEVDGSQGSGASAAWLAGVGLAGLGLLLGLAHVQRYGVALALAGLLIVLQGEASRERSYRDTNSEALWHTEQQPLPAGIYQFWGGKLSLEVSFAGDDGLKLFNVAWTKGTSAVHFITSLSVPYIEVKPQGQAAIKLEIPNPPKFSRLSILKNPVCDPQRLPGGPLLELWGVEDIGRELEAHYDLEVKNAQGQKLGMVNLVFSFRFYYPSWCRNSRAPEFYPQVRYTVQGFPVEKVRVPMRINVDPDGVPSGNFLQHVPMMTKEPLPDIIGENQKLPVSCAPAQAIILEPAGKEGRLVCVHREFMEENFDNYHEAKELIIAPSCHRSNPCFHFHLLKPALGHKFLVVEWHDGELEPQKLRPPKEPEQLLGDPLVPDKPCQRPWGKEPCELLLDPVFWYIAESDKPQDVFAADSPAWPAQFIGFSCSLYEKFVTIWIVVPIHIPLGYPSCG